LVLGQPIDLAPRLHDISVATLIVRGTLSAHVTPAALAALCAALRHGSAAEIGGAHHHVMLDAPDDLAHVLVDFFDGAAAGQGADTPPRPG
jgi:pimeloyl-ACP methyl ester carboxylesterase